eukprot:TRINITY_DN2340_c0_g1_i3.p1 TRINITY_DN2340_c0_g1~~TRINITY_DN2340_c0_g1_i3.p1  ORF type:complete len:657 (-),score=66.24 TRINITY_DN2340_c0_g1_i3:11-1981(-)
MKMMLLFAFFLNLATSSNVKVPPGNRSIVLTYSYYPLSDCKMGVYGPSNFKGIEVDIVREAFAYIGWKEEIDYFFECQPFAYMFDQLPKNRSILGAFKGITMRTDRMKTLVFSEPTIDSGITLLSKIRKNKWIYFTVVDKSLLFLTILLTPIFSAIILYLCDNFRQRIRDYIWHNICVIFQVQESFLKSPIAKLMQSAIWILYLVFVALYLAVLVNGISKERNFGGIYSTEDLKGKAVLTVSSYLSLMNTRYSTKTFTFQSGTPTDIIEQIFMNSTYDYLATDDPLLQTIATRNCEVGIALDNFLKLTFGIMFGSHTDPALLNAINKGIIQSRNRRIQSRSFSEFFAVEKVPKCSNRPTTGSQSFNINDLQAPFLFLTIGIGIALPIFAMNEIYKLILLAYKGNVLSEGVRADQETVLKSNVRNLYALYLYVSWKNLKFFNRLVVRLKGSLRISLGESMYARGMILGKQLKVVEMFKKNAFSTVPSPKNISRARLNFRRLVKKVILTEHYKVSAAIVNKFSAAKALPKKRRSISLRRTSLFSGNSERRVSIKSGVQLINGTSRVQKDTSWLMMKQKEKTKTLFAELCKKKPKLLSKKRDSSWWDRSTRPKTHRLEFKNGTTSEPIIIANETLRNLQIRLQKEWMNLNSNTLNTDEK